jgi:hypothetical protein
MLIFFIIIKNNAFFYVFVGSSAQLRLKAGLAKTGAIKHPITRKTKVEILPVVTIFS